MLCDHCGKYGATAHFTRVINGTATSLNLCNECMAQISGGGAFGNASGSIDNFSLGLSDLLGTVFGTDLGASPARSDDDVRCEGCGATFSDLSSTGMAGCAGCYATFYDRLLPSLQRIHGKPLHTGKLPRSAGPTARTRRQLDELRHALGRAVENQNFEEAASLRDEIRALEGQVDNL